MPPLSFAGPMAELVIFAMQFALGLLVAYVIA